MSRARAKRYLERWTRYTNRCVKIGGDVNPVGARVTAACSYYNFRWRRWLPPPWIDDFGRRYRGRPATRTAP